MKLNVFPSFKTRFLIIILGLFLILTVGVVLLNYSLLNGYIKSLLAQGIRRDNSSATVKLEQSKLIISFDLSDKEHGEALAFSRSLGVNGTWIEGISVDLDSETVAKLQPLLPTTVSVDFSENNVSFSNNRLPNLVSSSINQKYEFATRSGSLKLYSNNQTKFQLTVTDPEPLLTYATQSGKLALSEKVAGLFPILTKVATIDLSVNGKNSSGEIRLK